MTAEGGQGGSERGELPSGVGPELAQRNAEQQERFWALFEWLRIKVTKGLIWGAFFGVFWLLRDFFPLVFVTFVLAFIGASAVRLLERPLPRLRWRARTVIVFVGSGLLLGVLFVLAVPRVQAGVLELGTSVENFPEKWGSEVDPWLFENIPPYRDLVSGPVEEGPSSVESQGGEAAGERQALWEVETVRAFLERNQKEALSFLPGVLQGVATGVTAVLSLLFLSILFSFLIVLDLSGLVKEVKKLDETRLRGFYRETARDIVRFGEVLGRVLEAQAVISLVNTVLTAICLWALGVPSVVFLSLLVFVCGFVPVAGVFISSAPICLMALYSGGPPRLLLMVAVITGVHFLEAYVLNPRIMGAALKINPVLVLVILVIGHHAVGVWGLLLGLPVCYYFFTHVIKRERPLIGLRTRRRPASSPQS